MKKRSKEFVPPDEITYEEGSSFHRVARWLMAQDDPRWLIENGRPIIRQPMEALREYNKFLEARDAKPREAESGETSAAAE